MLFSNSKEVPIEQALKARKFANHENSDKPDSQSTCDEMGTDEMQAEQNSCKVRRRIAE